jgi:hypothetical protein
MYFNVLFATLKYKNRIIFQDLAHLQSHTIIGERICLLEVHNLKNENCIFYCFLQFLLLLIFIQSKGRRINISLDVTEYIRRLFSTEVSLFVLCFSFFSILSMYENNEIF